MMTDNINQLLTLPFVNKMYILNLILQENLYYYV